MPFGSCAAQYQKCGILFLIHVCKGSYTGVAGEGEVHKLGSDSFAGKKEATQQSLEQQYPHALTYTPFLKVIPFLVIPSFPVFYLIFHEVKENYTFMRFLLKQLGTLFRVKFVKKENSGEGAIPKKLGRLSAFQNAARF